MKWSYEIKKEPQPIILSISPSTDFLVIDDYDIQYSILLNKEQTKALIKALNSDRIKEWLNDVK